MAIKIRRHGRGVSFEQHGCVISELPAKPGPTHSVFDVLAAAVHAYSPGPRVRVAMLGFAGGGMLAPLRRLGGGHRVAGVDLSDEGYRIFREVAGEWGGVVRFAKEDAVSWMRRQTVRLDVVVEDLSISRNGDVVKPDVSWEVLPRLIEKKLKAGGVSITNLLPTPGMTWRDLIRACRHRDGVVIEFEHFYNRVVIQGRGLGTAREAGRILRAELRALGSNTADAIGVRTLSD